MDDEREKDTHQGKTSLSLKHYQIERKKIVDRSKVGLFFPFKNLSKNSRLKRIGWLTNYCRFNNREKMGHSWFTVIRRFNHRDELQLNLHSDSGERHQ